MQTNKIQPGHIFTTKKIYVDMDTGEELTQHQAKTHYLIIKKDKTNERKSPIKTRITIIYNCRKNPQTRLWGTTD